MESMDRNQAFAYLGLPDDATHDDILSSVDARRRQLELRLQAVSSPEQRRLLERALADLEEIRALAMLDPRDPAAGLPGGANIALKAGTMVADRYVIKERLGVGERGTVYRALDLTWGKDVALKVLLPEALLVPGIMDRLAAMLRRTLGFSHPGLCSVYSLGRSDDITFIASELIEGETLRQHFERGLDRPLDSTGLSAEAIEAVIRPISAALIYASDRAPHLNLKPENVLIANDGAIKITDFGLDEVMTVIPRGRSRAMTEQRRFRSPEQVRRSRNLSTGKDMVDARADQFALAAIVYFLATGLAPAAEADDLALKRPDLPRPLINAVHRALSSSPDERFATLPAFIDALFAKVSSWRRVLYGALIVIAAVLVGGLAFWANDQSGFERTLSKVSHWYGRTADRDQAAGLEQRAEAQRDKLQAAERGLRQGLRDAEQALAATAHGTDAGNAAALARAHATRDMYAELEAVALPQIFNSADVLNAYNMLSLAHEQMASGHYRDAIATFSSAETTMNTRLADWRTAEAWARRRHGLSTEAADGDAGTTQSADAGPARAEFARAIDQGMVLVPAGNFIMGDMAGDGSRAEVPAHRVALAAFKLGRTPVTRADFAACVKAGACRDDVASGDNPNLPITGVNWFDAQDYVAWLRARTGEDYRLPSEAEWEYAARAGTTTAYPWGAAVGRNHANCANCGSGWDRVGPAPVGSFAANAFGLYDVVGNVWQWTSDCWYRDYGTAPADGRARDEFGCARRVLRGGSWDNDAWMARLSYRGGAPASLRQDINGFRIAKSVE